MIRKEISDIQKTPAQIPLFLLSHKCMFSIPPAPHQNTSKAVSHHGKPDPLNCPWSVKGYCKMRETLPLIFVDTGEGKASRHGGCRKSISTLLHTLLYTYNSWILLCPSNCPSAPGCKGRALSAPAMTLSQIPHPSSAPESLITPRAEAQLPHLILRGCYLQEIRFLHWMAFLIQSRRVCCLLKRPPFPDKPVALPVSAALETPLLPISALAIAGVCQDALQSLCKPELCCPSQPCTLPLRPGNFGSFGNWTSSLSTNTPSTWEPWSRETPQSHPLHLQGEHSSQLES